MTSVAEVKEKIEQAIASLHDFREGQHGLVMWGDEPCAKPIGEPAPEPTFEYIEIKSIRACGHYEALMDEVRKQIVSRGML